MMLLWGLEVVVDASLLEQGHQTLCGSSWELVGLFCDET